MKERELKEAFLKGDREGFQKVVSAFSSEMMALSMDIVGNREDAENVCQVAFLQAFRNSDRFDPEQSLRHWLLTIVYRRSLDLIRRKRLTGLLNRFSQNFYLFASAHGALNQEKAKLNGPEIPARAFNGLTVRQRVILTL
ncbi:MAG: RNA polymerase sigma factor [Candidatus Aminicenantales bacterium]